MPAKRITSETPWPLVLVLDDSDSMEGEGSVLLEQAVVALVTELRQRTGGGKYPCCRISIIKMGDEAVPLARWVSEMEVDLSVVRSLAGSSGRTFVGDALHKARELMEQHAGKVTDYDPYLILISDGGGSDQSQALEAAEELKAKRYPCGYVRLVTVGVGQANGDWLQQLASTREGRPRYLHLSTGRDILGLLPPVGSPALPVDVPDVLTERQIVDDFQEEPS